MFHSARLKLTLFYLAGVVVLILSLNIGARILVQHEFQRSNVLQRGAVRHLIDRFAGFPLPDDQFVNLQQQREVDFSDRISRELTVLSIAVFAIGGAASYWFAGRTLKPIEEAHDAQRRFAADASHELRTPLTVMRTENEVFLRQKDFSKPEAKKLIASNLEEVKRLEDLSSNLLSLTDYETTTLNLGEVNVEKLVAEATSSCQKTHPDSKAKIIIKVAPAKILGHADSLSQLICILLDNAYKYGPSEGTIIIHGTKQQHGYRISVEDEGKGITSADLPYIFDRLFRGDKARTSHVSGYGLGLSLAREITKANRASIEAKNQPRGGAQFIVTLPII